MKHCPQCGARVAHRVPDGDDRERAVCPACGHVHYENPRVVVGCIVEHEGAVLLCRRAIEPASGRWTLPAGYLELGESAVAGAVRETREEACAAVEVLAPHSFLDLPHIGQLYAIYRARLVDEHFAAGEETDETLLFDLASIPWDELAFPSIRFALELYVADREQERHQVHMGVVHYNGAGARFDARSYELRERVSVRVEG